MLGRNSRSRKLTWKSSKGNNPGLFFLGDKSIAPMSVVSTSNCYKPRTSGMLQVYRPTPLVRFMLKSETWLKASHVLHATSNNAGAFLCTTLCRGTRRNTLQFERCKITTYLFFARDEKAEKVFRLGRARLSSPGVNAGAFRRDLVN